MLATLALLELQGLVDPILEFFLSLILHPHQSPLASRFIRGKLPHDHRLDFRQLLLAILRYATPLPATL